MVPNCLRLDAPNVMQWRRYSIHFDLVETHYIQGAPHKVGPNLNGLFSRQSGTAAGYSYSASMVKKQVQWSKEEMFVYRMLPIFYN